MRHDVEDPRTLAEVVRSACLKAAADAYEDAGLQGLCAEGRFERALDAVRELDLARVVAEALAPAPAEEDELTN